MSNDPPPSPWRDPDAERCDPSPTEVIRPLAVPPAAPTSSAVDPTPTEQIPRVRDTAPGSVPEGVQGAARRGRTAAGGGARRVVSRRRRIARRTLVAGAAVLALVVGGSAAAYVKLDGNIRSVELPFGPKPSSSATVDAVTNLPPLNILLMGSDSRAGADAKYGNGSDYGKPRSDVTMIAHLAADRKSAVVVSLPRDTMVKGPSPASNETTCDLSLPEDRWTTSQLTEYYSRGGPQCTVKVVQAMTGIPIDHVAIVDFTGFKDMVDAIGTVPVCLTHAVKDEASGADFPAGKQRLNGEQALSFVRVRHGIGDGGDISRIKRQQDFLSSMIREAMSAELLSNPVHTYQFLDAATKSLSSDLNIRGMGDIAASLRGLHSGDIRFVSMPWEPYPPKPDAWVQPSAAAATVWTILKTDAPWPASPDAAASAAPTTSSPAPVSSLTPSQVSVDVVNASGQSGIAKQTADALRVQGFVIGATTSQDTVGTGVVIHYPAGEEDKAREVGAAFTAATLRPDGVAGQALRIELGKGASKVRLVPNAPAGVALPPQPLEAPPAPTAGATIQVKTADRDICSGGNE